MNGFADCFLREGVGNCWSSFPVAAAAPPQLEKATCRRPA